MADGTPNEIEREIEAERAEMTSTLEDLQRQLSPENLVGSLGEQLSTHGAEIGQAVGRTIRDNPAAAALTGLGLAWLVIGSQVSRSGDDDRARSPEAHHTPIAPADFEDHDPDGDDGRLAALWDRVQEGTEELSQEARARVVAARRRAIRAQARVEASTRRARQEARRAYSEKPLIAGAVSAAIGAAIGAALPRTDLEDRHLGRETDRLFDEAERIFETEMRRARQMAEAALHETGEMAREALDEVGDRVPDGREAIDRADRGLRNAGDRISRAAMEARDKE